MLMTDQPGRGFDYFRHVDGYFYAGAQTAEIKQPIGNCLTAKCFIANQAQILAQVLSIRRATEGAFLYTLFQRLGARRNCREWIIYFMNDTCGQPADRCQLFRARDGPVSFDPRGNVLANRDHVRDFARFVRTHRDFANQPMVDFARFGEAVLLDAVNLTGGEDFAEFTVQQFAALGGENFEDILPERFAGRQPELTKFAISVPGAYAIFAIDSVERHRQTVDYRFGKALLHFRFSRAAIDFLRQGGRRFTRAKVQRGDMCGQRCLLSCGTD